VGGGGGGCGGWVVVVERRMGRGMPKTCMYCLFISLSVFISASSKLS